VASRLFERSSAQHAEATRVASARLEQRSSPIAHAHGDASASEGEAFARSIHEGPRHTHRARGVGPESARLVWSSAIGGAVEAQVVASADDKTLYVASLDGALSALDAGDGSRRWRVALGDRAYGAPCVGQDGAIYVGTDAKRFFAIRPDGSVAWTLDTEGEADTAATMTPDGLLVFAAGAHVYAVRAGGDVAWRFDAAKKVFTAPAVFDDGRVVFGSQDHHVYAVRPGGALAWSVDLGADVDGAPAIADDGAVVVGDDAGEVVRIDPDGNVAWRTRVGGFVRGPLSIARDGDVLAGVYGPSPRMIRVAPDGAVRSSFAVRGTGAAEFGVHGGALEDSRGALYFGAQDDEVHAIGPEGAWEWSFTTGADVDAPLTLLASGALVAASDDGTVYLFAR